MVTFFRSFGSLRTLPEPRATADSASLARVIGKPVASRKRVSRPLIREIGALENDYLI